MSSAPQSNKPIAFTLELPPTYAEVDVILGGSRKNLIKHLVRTYAESYEYYDQIIKGSFCGIVTLNGHDRILMAISNFSDLPVIAHEIVHCTWKLDALVGFNFNQKNQEIQAYYVSYILGKVLAVLNTE
jgi:hypothetical protein